MSFSVKLKIEFHKKPLPEGVHNVITQYLHSICTVNSRYLEN